VPDGVVATVVPKLEFEGLPSKGLTQDLVAHADAKHWLLAQDGLGILNSIGGSRRVTLCVWGGGGGGNSSSSSSSWSPASKFYAQNTGNAAGGRSPPARLLQ
jgi:hypothetical protein